MPSFKIEIKETLSRVIDVEATSSDSAFSMVQNLYKNQAIVLDSNDCI
jgi:phage gp37-like protein